MTINTLYQSGRMPHAVLFAGEDDGCVERALALYQCPLADTVFVKAMMPPSDTEKKSAKHKPPYSYKIDAIREIVGSGAMRPQFGEARVFVFREFDTMDSRCQNALLKFIEEPAEYNRFIMTAGSLGKILPTVLSRVVVVSPEQGAESGVPEHERGQKPGEEREIAKAIIAGLKVKDEYSAAKAFSGVKDRQALVEVLRCLLEEFAAVMPGAKSPQKVINAADVVQKYIRRAEVNPNINITTAACIAELYAQFWL